LTKSDEDVEEVGADLRSYEDCGRLEVKQDRGVLGRWTEFCKSGLRLGLEGIKKVKLHQSYMSIVSNVFVLRLHERIAKDVRASLLLETCRHSSSISTLCSPQGVCRTPDNLDFMSRKPFSLSAAVVLNVCRLANMIEVA